MMDRLPGVCVLAVDLMSRYEMRPPSLHSAPYLTERKLAMAPAPSAETEAVAPDPEMPATVILPALVMAALLLEAWVMVPTVAEPPTDAVSAMLDSENDATEPLEPIDAD